MMPVSNVTSMTTCRIGSWEQFKPVGNSLETPGSSVTDFRRLDRLTADYRCRLDDSLEGAHSTLFVCVFQADVGILARTRSQLLALPGGDTPCRQGDDEDGED